MNGAVEAANKNIKRILAKMTKNYKEWHEMLPFALHVYRTLVRVSTGMTPYSLVYGMEAVLPIELDVPSARILTESEINEDELIRKRIDHLNLIDEKRVAALCHGQAYQRRMATAFNKKVRPRQFRAGELVLKYLPSSHRDERGKFSPNFDGPFIVKKALPGGAVILAHLDGT